MLIKSLKSVCSKILISIYPPRIAFNFGAGSSIIPAPEVRIVFVRASALRLASSFALSLIAFGSGSDGKGLNWGMPLFFDALDWISATDPALAAPIMDATTTGSSPEHI